MAKTSKDFFKKVYDIVREVPYGRVTTYGAIAKALGAAKSARVVGYAMNASHQYDDVPAHRVVNRNGVLTGKHHFPGTQVMQQMLEAEGVEIYKDKIVNFEQHLWIPKVQN